MQCQDRTQWGWWGGGARQRGVQWSQGADGVHLKQTYSPVPSRWARPYCLLLTRPCCPQWACPPPTLSPPRCCRGCRWSGVRPPAPGCARPPVWAARCQMDCRSHQRWPSSCRRSPSSGFANVGWRSHRGTWTAREWSGRCPARIPDLDGWNRKDKRQKDNLINYKI